MKTAYEWDRWLRDCDSAHTLALEGYDDAAADIRAKALGHQLTSILSDFEVRRGSTELYQDSTGLVGHRITAKGDLRPFAPTLAWVVLSHFGDLATVAGCEHPELLVKICGVLEVSGFKYIPYEYVANKMYDGMCKALVGFSWANRYFELCVDFNYDALKDWPELS
jgi:hypothetical protein